MKDFTKMLWGMVLIVLGLIIGINALGIAEIDIFFDGWWTLFIIIPSLIGLFDGKDRQGSAIGLFVGLFLLLAVRDIISFELVLKLLIPSILVIIGLSLIFSETFKGQVKEKVEASQTGDTDEVAAVLKEDIRIVDGTFESAAVDAVFGHAILDIRKSKIKDEATIKASAIFGSIDIIVPSDVTVKLKSSKVFGSIEKLNYAKDKDKKDKVIYIEAFSMFGSIKIK